MRLRSMKRRDWAEVAALVHFSTNGWYEAHGRGKIFTAGPDSTLLFCEVYEDLDPGCCVVAEDRETGLIAGSCFYHPRETHVSLGIMNAHPSWFGRGVASSLLRFVIAEADRRGLPLRLVSSAMNLDSYSLYTRHGFVPRAIYQDLILAVPSKGVPVPPEARRRLRDARPDDLPGIVALEDELHGIRRGKDHRYFVENRSGIWHASVLTGKGGAIEGFLASVSHPGSRMIGPGFARTESGMEALLRRELDYRRGETQVFLLPADRPGIIGRMHALGARNCELHVQQVRGDWRAPAGVVMPTFMPETC